MNVDGDHPERSLQTRRTQTGSALGPNVWRARHQPQVIPARHRNNSASTLTRLPSKACPTLKGETGDPVPTQHQLPTCSGQLRHQAQCTPLGAQVNSAANRNRRSVLLLVALQSCEKRIVGVSSVVVTIVCGIVTVYRDGWPILFKDGFTICRSVKSPQTG